MKKNIVKLIATSLIALAPVLLSAQPQPGQNSGGGSVGGDPIGGGAPIGSGIALFMALGAAYGIKKWRKAEE